ncbi:MAG: AI-2E family transporter [Verrucomicrobiales bacterium]|nr:AI-2E family transporter [Verrucomicrobiales bacterium]
MACVVLLVAGLKAASSLFIPIMLGLFLAMLSMPILNWLDRRGLPRPLAVLMTILVDLLILGGIVFLTSGVIGNFTENSVEYTEKLRNQAAEFSRTMDQKIAQLEQLWSESGENGQKPESAPVDNSSPAPETIVVPEVSPPAEGEVLEEDGPPQLVPSITFSKLFDLYWDSSRILEFVGQIDVVNRFTSLASTIFFALIVMIFVLAESGGYAEKVRAVLQVRGPDLRRFQSISNDIQKYLGIKTAVSLLTGVLAMLACLAFRVDFPLLWGLVAFLFNFVPAIGSILAGIPPVLLALILHGFWPATGVLACYLVINVAIGNFLEPMLLGDRFGISTVIVILSVLVWGFIWGPVGMLLAVPLTMLVKVMLDNSSDLRWISALMGKRKTDLVPETDDEDHDDEEAELAVETSVS